MERVLAVIAAVGCGVFGGTMFAFSTSVVPALRRLPPAQAVATMRSFNAAILNPAFLLTFLGTTLCCAALLVTTLLGEQSGLRIAGAALFLVGAFGVTSAVNVPLNNRLERDGSDEFWRQYAARWTAWNNLRALASAAAAALLVLD